MNIETKDGKIIVAEHHSGRDAWTEGRGLAAVSVVLGIFMLVASLGLMLAFGIPATRVFSWATLEPFVIIGAVSFAIAAICLACAVIAAPFDTGFEFVFDPQSKTCAYKRVFRLRRWNIDLRGPPETLTFAAISGVGVREISEAGSFVYQPMLFIGRRALPLASGSGSYLGLEPKLDLLRQATGLPKRDRDGSTLYQGHTESIASAARDRI